MKRWAAEYFGPGNLGHGVPALAGGARAGRTTREIFSISSRAHVPPPEAVAMQLTDRRRPGGSRRGQPKASIQPQTFASPARALSACRPSSKISPFGRCEPPRRRRSNRVVPPEGGTPHPVKNFASHPR